MAIKVVQGLIDSPRPDSLRSAGTPSNDGKNTAASNAQSPAYPTQSQTATSAQSTLSQSVVAQTLLTQNAASQARMGSEATIMTLRARPSTIESAKIRDPEKAHEIADSIAERVVDYDDEAMAAHSDLDAASARSHFTH